MTILVKGLEDKSIAGNLFVDLLGEMQLLAAYAAEHFVQSGRYMLLLQWLLKMVEELGHEVITDVVQLCAFVKAMLSNRDEETLGLALGLLSLMLSGEAVKFTKEEEVLIFDLTDELEVVHLLPNLCDQVKDLAAELRTRIIAGDRSKWVMSTEEQSRHEEDSKGKKETLEDALKYLQDPLLPVRAQGLVALRKLVLDRDQSVVDENMDNVLTLFKTQLADSDSYVYGHAINGLTALGDVRPKKVIPILTEYFSKEGSSIETKLKVAEALTKVAHRCGETLPVYGT